MIPTRAPTPTSIVRKLNSEKILLLGWGPAILMQLAHPLVAAGVANHSVFVACPAQRLQRLQQTVAAMLALTFGTDQEVARAARAINTIHDRVHGRLREPVGSFPAGTPYSAHDPALLCWVHATLLYTLPRTYELFVGPLTPEEKDRYYAEASWIGPLLGIPDGVLPASSAALREYMQGMLASGEIVVTPTAHDLARELLAQPGLQLPRPLHWFAQLPTLGLLPAPLRAAYGLPWDSRRARALRLSAALARCVLPRLPSTIHHWPTARAAAHRDTRERGEPTEPPTAICTPPANR